MNTRAQLATIKNIDKEYMFAGQSIDNVAQNDYHIIWRCKNENNINKYQSK